MSLIEDEQIYHYADDPTDDDSLIGTSRKESGNKTLQFRLSQLWNYVKQKIKDDQEIEPITANFIKTPSHLSTWVSHRQQLNYPPMQRGDSTVIKIMDYENGGAEMSNGYVYLGGWFGPRIGTRTLLICLQNSPGGDYGAVGSRYYVVNGLPATVVETVAELPDEPDALENVFYLLPDGSMWVFDHVTSNFSQVGSIIKGRLISNLLFRDEYNEDVVPSGGMFYYDTDTKIYYKWDGSRYIDISIEDGGQVNQNNKVKELNIVQKQPEKTLAQTLNSYHNLQVSEIDNYLIKFYSLPYKSDPKGSKILYEKSVWLFARGKGTFGSFGAPVHDDDFLLIYKQESGGIDSETPGRIEVITKDNVDRPDHAVNESLNGPFVITENEAVFFILETVNQKNFKTWRWVGGEGTFGIGETQTDMDDFDLVEFNDTINGGDDDATGNIKVVEISLNQVDPEDDVSDLWNALPEFTVKGDELYLIHYLDLQVTASETTNVVKQKYLLKRGAGSYGVGGTVLALSDFAMISNPVIVATSNSSSPTVYEIEDSELGQPEISVNNSPDAPYTIGVGEDVFFIIRNGSFYELYRWVGVDGSFGGGATPSTGSDFLLIDSSESANSGGEGFMTLNTINDVTLDWKASYHQSGVDPLLESIRIGFMDKDTFILEKIASFNLGSLMRFKHSSFEGRGTFNIEYWEYDNFSQMMKKRGDFLKSVNGWTSLNENGDLYLSEADIPIGDEYEGFNDDYDPEEGPDPHTLNELLQFILSNSVQGNRVNSGTGDFRLNLASPTAAAWIDIEGFSFGNPTYISRMETPYIFEMCYNEDGDGQGENYQQRMSLTYARLGFSDGRDGSSATKEYYIEPVDPVLNESVDSRHKLGTDGGVIVTSIDGQTANREGKVFLTQEYIINLSTRQNPLVEGEFSANFFQAPYSCKIVEMWAQTQKAPTGSSINISVAKNETFVGVSKMFMEIPIGQRKSNTDHDIVTTDLAALDFLEFKADQIGSGDPGLGVNVFLKIQKITEIV